MKKLAVQLIKELTSLSDTIPAGFKGFFAKTTGFHFKDSSAVEHKLVSTNKKYSSTDFEKAILTNTILWPNCYDATRPSIKNAILNSGDVLVNFIELGGTVVYSNGIGTIQAVHVAGQAGVIANETNRTQYLDGGSGYTVGNVLTLLSGDNNATVTVASVDGNGKVITVTLTAAGTNYKTNASCAVSGGTGTGCKIYITFVNGSARNPAGANYINKVFQSEGQAQSSGGNLFWTNVSPTNPVEILLTMPVVTKSVHQLLLVPGGRNRHPFNYKVETTSAETTYYGGQNRWHQAIAVTTETDTYIKLINTLASEQVKYIRITIYDAGDNDLINSFALGYLIGYQRYIGDGRFTGYSMSASGDTVFGDYIFRGANHKTDNTKEVKILPEEKKVVVGGVSLASGTETINFDATIEPTQTGTVAKTTLWMFQYLAQGIKWLRDNFANYSPTTHNHNLASLAEKNYSSLSNIPTTFTPSAHNHTLDSLSEKSYKSLTDKPTIPAAQVQTDWDATTGLGVLLNKPASLPANGGDADTLEGLSSSAFAKIGTAFTSFGNIAGNNADCAVVVIDTSLNWSSTEIKSILTDDITLPSGTTSIVLILQPGIYEIAGAIDFASYNVRAIIGLCPDSTIINVDDTSLIMNLELIENLTINIEWSTAGNILANSSLSKAEAHNLKIKYTGSLGYDAEITCFSEYTNITNCTIEGITGVAYKSNNISNITHICENINNYTSVAALQRAVNVSNFTGRYSLPIAVGGDSINLSNFLIEFSTADNQLRTCFDSCVDLSNIRILNCDIGFNSCENISNAIVETDVSNTATVAYSNCNLLSNCKAVAYVGFGGCHRIVSSEASSCNIGFYSSAKISLSRGSGCTAYGFDSCTGLVQNSSDNYNSCFADSNAIYAVADTPGGGFNS